MQDGQDAPWLQFVTLRRACFLNSSAYIPPQLRSDLLDVGLYFYPYFFVLFAITDPNKIQASVTSIARVTIMGTWDQT